MRPRPWSTRGATGGWRQSSQLARQLESQRKLLDVSTGHGHLEQEDILEVVADGLKAVVSYDNLSIYRADIAKQVLVPVLTREEHAREVARYIIPFDAASWAGSWSTRRPCSPTTRWPIPAPCRSRHTARIPKR